MHEKDSQKEKRRFFAITALSRSRWYWVVWPSLAEVRAASEPVLVVGDGYEGTKAKAVLRALELAGRDAEWIEAKYARLYQRSKTGSHRGEPGEAGPGGGSAPVVHEFLYRDVLDAVSGQWVSVPHRVVKKTKNYIFVEQQPYAPEEMSGGWLDREPPTYRLDRQMLEQEGYAFIAATEEVADSEQPMFYSSEQAGPVESSALQCLEVLQLHWPCSVEEVKGAYRRLVKSAHPDGGGSQEQFLGLQAAYEQALLLCEGTN